MGAEPHADAASATASDRDAVPRLLDLTVTIARSIHREYVVCLENGKKFELLRRHLSMSHGMSGEDYRRRWGLSQHYPVVAPAYGAPRRLSATSP